MKYNDENEKVTENYRVEEAAPKYYAKQGEYTLEDYYALPEDVRAELIDGILYYFSAPTTIHQEIVGNLFAQLVAQIGRKNGKCKVFVSPIDVQLDCDDKTMVQPDVLILCDLDKQKKQVIYGAPDFVVEILSPSTRKKDLTIKHRKYLNAGVREYWIVDPKEKRLITYDFENGEKVGSYPFTENVGLAIYDGKITVDLTELAEIVNED